MKVLDKFIIVTIIIFAIINLLYFTGIIPHNNFIITFNNTTEYNSSPHVPIIYVPINP